MMPNFPDEAVETQLANVLFDLENERKKRTQVEAELATERSKRERLDATLHNTEMRRVTAQEHLANAQVVLNCRLHDARKLAQLECEVDGCPGPEAPQAPLVQWACKCTVKRHACMHCISQSMQSYTMPGDKIECGFKCPFCSCLTTKWGVVNIPELLPERWKTNYEMY